MKICLIIAFIIFIFALNQIKCQKLDEKDEPAINIEFKEVEWDNEFADVGEELPLHIDIKPENKIDLSFPDDLSAKSEIKTLTEYFEQRFYKIRKETKEKLDFTKSPAGYVLTSDKAVYKPGETIMAQVYFYDKYSKMPRMQISDDILKGNAKLVLKNGNDQEVQTIKKFKQGDSALVFKISLPESQAGGFYRLEFQNAPVSLVQRQTVYILSFASPSEILNLNLSKDVVTAGDKIFAEVTFKVLTRQVEPSSLKNLPLNARVVDNFGSLITQMDQKTNQDAKGFFAFELPKKLEYIKSLTLIVSLDYAGKTFRVSKEMTIASLDDLYLEFNVSTGKWVVDQVNQVYFQTFATVDKKSPFILETGNVVIKKINDKDDEPNEVKNEEIVKSSKNGMGKFDLNIEKGFSYWLRVQRDGQTKDFYIIQVNKKKPDSPEDFSNVHMYLSNTVLTQENKLTISLQTAAKIKATTLWMVIQDKTKVLLEKEVTLKSHVGEMNINISELNIPNGGVVTVQIFRNKSFGTPDQESLLYIHPLNKLNIKATLDKQIYLPESQVQLKLKAKKDTLWNIIVTNEASFLQIEQKRLPPSLPTKVFLENELFFESKEFQEAGQYIDWFFENNHQKLSFEQIHANNLALELLLGNQGWRKFFLAGDKITDIVNDNDSFGKEQKGNLEYLLARKLSDLEPHFGRFGFEDMVMMRSGPMMMMVILYFIIMSIYIYL